VRQGTSGTYYFVAGIGGDIYFTMLEVMKEGCMYIPSETTEIYEVFRTKSLKRDMCCAFTGVSAEEGDSIHIIPYKRGSE